MLAILGGTGLYELQGMEIDEQLDAGTPFDQACASVFRGQPQPLFEAWVTQQAARGPRR